MQKQFPIRELEVNMEEKGQEEEWAEAIRKLDNLQQVELHMRGGAFLLRSELLGHAPQAIRGAGAAMPAVVLVMS